MNPQLLRQTIDLLVDLRSELHGVVDSSVIDQLDSVIQKLEADYANGEHNISSIELLYLLGEFIKLMPILTDLISRYVE